MVVNSVNVEPIQEAGEKRLSGTATVSVIIPSYNRAGTLGEAIDSVLAQRIEGLELIIVDDGSTDDTDRVLAAYASDPRVRILKQANAGQAAARNRGLSAASGEFICFLDSDNRWKPGKLERQLALMAEHPEAGVIYGNNETIDASGQVVGRSSMRRHSGWITEHLLIDNCVSFNTAIVRREYIDAVGGMDESVRFGDDYDLWLRMSVHCPFLHVDELWGQYRIEGDRISSNVEARLESNRQTVERFLERHQRFATPTWQRFVWSRFLVRRGRSRASAGRRRAALLDYLAAARYRPWSAHVWRAMARLMLTGR